MNNISDKNVMMVVLVTILIVFALVFSVKSPERKIIESPIMWKEDFSNNTIFDNEKVELINLKNKRIYTNYLMWMNIKLSKIRYIIWKFINLYSLIILLQALNLH